MAKLAGDEKPSNVINLKDALSERYLAYALSTITSRSLPDLRDGLKPVQRRILFAMMQLRLDPQHGYKKCARVVGDVIGKFHPHGDSAVYEAMVRMAQGFAQRYPLVDGQGNFGNIDGDNAAAMRYTESRLTPVAMALLAGLDEDTVDFRDNYDGSDSEPVVLPAAFPNLLANGASGIAVGMATSIPPHNAGEIIDALVHMLDRPLDAPLPTVRELCQFIKAPDLPTGGIIIDPMETMVEAYESGRGGVRVRARWEVEKLSHGQYQIIITEIPYLVQKSRLIERMAELLAAKKLSLLGDLRDESSEELRVVLIPKSRSVEPALLMEQLFKRTELESRLTLNMNVLDGHGIPAVLGLDSILFQFLQHRMQVLERRSRYRLGKIDDRLEVLEGYLKAFLDLDRVIQIIREDDDPKASLISEFKLTERQAEAILNLRLRHLRKLEEIALQKESRALRAERKQLDALLKDEKLRRERLIAELKDVRSAHADARRTSLEQPPSIDENLLEEPVERFAATVICSKRGWIRVVRGHIDDSSELKYKEGDAARFVLTGQNSDKLLAFSTDGRTYSVPVEKLPSGRGLGEPISMLFDLPEGADLFSLQIWRPDGQVLVASKDGRGFLAAEKDLAAQTRNGRQTVNLSQGDALQVVRQVAGDHVAVVGSNRKLLIFPVSEIPQMSRGRGVILQKYRGAFLSDATTVSLNEGLRWKTGSRIRHEKDLTTWLGRRASAGRMAPTGFPKDNRFHLIASSDHSGAE